MKKDIRNHPYHFEQALQRHHHHTTTPSSIVNSNSNNNNNNNISNTNTHGLFNTTTSTYETKHPLKTKNSTYFTWLVFMSAKWVPFDGINQSKLEQSQQLGGTFVDIEDSNFPKVKRVRVFPKSNYLSYLGVKYRLSRVMQPDAWSDSHDMISTTSTTTTSTGSSAPPPHMITRTLPPPPQPSVPSRTTTSSSSTTTDLNDWRSTPHRSSQTLISHVLS